MEKRKLGKGSTRNRRKNLLNWRREVGKPKGGEKRI